MPGVEFKPDTLPLLPQGIKQVHDVASSPSQGRKKLQDLPVDVLCEVSRYLDEADDRASLRLTSHALLAAADTSRPKIVKKIAQSASEAYLRGSPRHPRLPQLLDLSGSLRVEINGDENALVRAVDLLGKSTILRDLHLNIEVLDLLRCHGPDDVPLGVTLGQSIQKQTQLKQLTILGDFFFEIPVAAALAPCLMRSRSLTSMTLGGPNLSYFLPYVQNHGHIEELSLFDTADFRGSQNTMYDGGSGRDHRDSVRALPVDDIIRVAKSLNNLTEVNLNKTYSLSHGEELLANATMARQLKSLAIDCDNVTNDHMGQIGGPFILPPNRLDCLSLQVGQPNKARERVKRVILSSAQLRELYFSAGGGVRGDEALATILRDIGKRCTLLTTLSLTLDETAQSVAAVTNLFESAAHLTTVKLTWEPVETKEQKPADGYIQALAALPRLGQLGLNFTVYTMLGALDTGFWSREKRFAKLHSLDLEGPGVFNFAISGNLAALCHRLDALETLRLGTPISVQSGLPHWPKLQRAALYGSWTFEQIGSFAERHTSLQRLTLGRISSDPNEYEFFHPRMVLELSLSGGFEVGVTELRYNDGPFLPSGLKFPNLVTLCCSGDLALHDIEYSFLQKSFKSAMEQAPRLKRIYIKCCAESMRQRLRAIFNALNADLATMSPGRIPIRFCWLDNWLELYE